MEKKINMQQALFLSFLKKLKKTRLKKQKKSSILIIR